MKFKQLFCLHNYIKESVTKIERGVYRYQYKCSKCGKVKVETWKV